MPLFDKEQLQTLRQDVDRWTSATLKKTLDRRPERQQQFISTSSVPVRRIYTPLDIADLDYGRDLAMPGEFPYTRGIHSTMYRGRLWTMRMFSGFGSAEETNQRYKYLLKQGNMGLSVASTCPPCTVTTLTPQKH